MRHTLTLITLLLAASAALLTACDDDETYADKRKREDKQIKAFLSSGALVKDATTGDTLFYAPGNIKTISQSEFERDTITNVDENEYVYFERSGVYMQIVERGTGTPLASGQKANIVTRYTEFNIAGDSIQSTNKNSSYEMKPDVMSCENTSGTFTATFFQGAMYDTYSSQAVPAGWLVPMSYINLGRLVDADSRLARVRLIVPGAQGHANASSNVYACFYDITYQRGI